MIKNIILLSAVILMVFTGSGCRRTIHSKDELRRYIANKENGLLSEKKTHTGISVKLSYLPAVLLRKDMHIQDRHYFLFNLSKDGRELLRQVDFNTYSDLLRVLSFRMAPLISLVADGKQPVQADDCFFQQTFGMTAANELLIVFDGRKIGKARRFNIKISEFGLNTGDLNFDFAAKDIQKVSGITEKQLSQ